MAENPPDERLVYLAFKPIFKGSDAQLRRPKKIRDLIKKHRNFDSIRDLLHEHNIDNVCSVTRDLLEDHIFESTLKAKIRFPEVFEVSPSQSAERAASEAEAAKIEANAIKDAAQGRDQEALGPVGDGNGVLHAGKIKRGGEAKAKGKEISFEDCTAQPRQLPSPHPTISAPSLYPVYLPFKAQHQLFVRVQALLENACYMFGQKTMHDILQQEGWDCPEAVELNQWSRVFKSNRDKFPTEKLKELGKPLAELLESISQLRHTAVHRLRVSVTRIEQFMVDAEALANLLQDDACARTLFCLQQETQLIIDELKRNKDLLESRLADTLKKFAAQRVELWRLEHIAVEEMLREDREYQNLAGGNLEKIITTFDPILQSVTATNPKTNSTVSEADTDASHFEAENALIAPHKQ